MGQTVGVGGRTTAGRTRFFPAVGTCVHPLTTAHCPASAHIHLYLPRATHTRTPHRWMNVTCAHVAATTARRTPRALRTHTRTHACCIRACCRACLPPNIYTPPHRDGRTLTVQSPTPALAHAPHAPHTHLPAALSTARRFLCLRTRTPHLLHCNQTWRIPPCCASGSDAATRHALARACLSPHATHLALLLPRCIWFMLRHRTFHIHRTTLRTPRTYLSADVYHRATNRCYTFTATPFAYAYCTFYTFVAVIRDVRTAARYTFARTTAAAPAHTLVLPLPHTRAHLCAAHTAHHIFYTLHCLAHLGSVRALLRAPAPHRLALPPPYATPTRAHCARHCYLQLTAHARSLPLCPHLFSVQSV